MSDEETTPPTPEAETPPVAPDSVPGGPAAAETEAGAADQAGEPGAVRRPDRRPGREDHRGPGRQATDQEGQKVPGLPVLRGRVQRARPVLVPGDVRGRGLRRRQPDQ